MLFKWFTNWMDRRIYREPITIADCRNPEEFGGFEYFNLRGEPVRVVLNDDAFPISADGLDAATASFVRNLTYLGPVDRDPFSDEITREEFYALCEKKIREYRIDKSKLSSTTQ